MTIEIHIAWPILVPLALLVWLPACAWIGNLLQREWWFNVLAFSVGALIVSIPFAISSVWWA